MKKTRILLSSILAVLLPGLLVASVSPLHGAYAIGTTLAPSAPMNLQVFGYDDHIGLVLIWNAPSGNDSSQILGYMIERSSDGGSTWTTIVQNTGSTQTAYGENCLAPDTKYTYRVSALSGTGTSEPSNTASTITHGAMTPDPPTSLVATVLSPSLVNLIWAAPSCDEGSLITKYKIERSADGGNTWSTLARGIEGNSFADILHGIGKELTYKITAVNSVGESMPLYVSANLQ